MAARAAQTSSCKMRVAAVITKGGRVVAKATNIDKNHPTILEPSKVRMHASICAERRALSMIKDARGATIYVARIKRDGSLGISKPCMRCERALINAGVSKVVYVG